MQITKRLALGAALLFTAATAAPASAQMLQLIPKIGAFAPLSDLQNANPDSVQSLKGGLAFGLAAEVKLPVLPRLRVGFDYASDSEISTSGVGTSGSAPNATVLAGTADLVLRPLDLALIHPFGLLGAGLKKYNVNEQDLQNANITDLKDQSHFTGHVGVGLGISLKTIGIEAEVSDYISNFDVNGSSKLQHDLFAMLGFSVGF